MEKPKLNSTNSFKKGSLSILKNSSCKKIIINIILYFFFLTIFNL